MCLRMRRHSSSVLEKSEWKGFPQFPLIVLAAILNHE
jgi:hypothetical protein